MNSKNESVSCEEERSDTDVENTTTASTTTKKKFHRRFREQWHKEFPWLRKKDDKGYCIFCNRSLYNILTHLKRHEKTSLHLKNVRIKSNQSLDMKNISLAQLHAELEDQAGDETGELKCLPDMEMSSARKVIIAEKKYRIKKETAAHQHADSQMSCDDLAEDGGEEYIDYDVQSEEDEDLADISADNDILMSSTSPGVSRKLQTERIKAETEYFKQKALYFSKLAENTRVQRTLMILQTRKLHIELKKLQNEF